jgi:cytochrome c biogenesis protein CcdA
MLASHPGSVLTSRDEKKREFYKLQGVVFAVFAVFMLAGTGIGFYGAFDTDSGPAWSRIACVGIGLIGLLLAFIFIIGSVQGFMRLTTRWSQRPPRR